MNSAANRDQDALPPRRPHQRDSTAEAKQELSQLTITSLDARKAELTEIFGESLAIYGGVSRSRLPPGGARAFRVGVLVRRCIA